MSLPGDRKLRLADRYELEEGGLYLSGLQALVRIPIDQHQLDQRNGLATATLISGYEGSPLAGYDLEIGRQRQLLERSGVVFRPAVNEELGADAVQGSQLASASADKTCDGVIGIWYGKAPGLDRATDALRHGNLGGAHPTGGVLVLVGDDSIAKSSTVPSSSEMAMAEIGMPVLAPADPQDVLDLGLHGIALSRFCGLWTGVKLATNVVDGAASVQVGLDRLDLAEPDRSIGGADFVHEVSANFLQPNLGRLEASLMGERLELARRYARANQLNRIEGDARARVGIIAAAQIISTAAGLAGLQVRSLDQLGLAQKGGAVISDIKLSSAPFTGANKVTPGSCDLYLGCDLLVAADAVNLAVTAPDRTVAVTCTSRVPTGAMVRDTAVAFPDVAATVARIHELTRAEHAVAVDARAETTALLGDDQFTNVFLVGAAVQAGALPIPARHIEEALELNGVAVERNIEAFRAGRRYVAGGSAPAAAPSGGGTRISPAAAQIVSGLGADPALRAVAGRRADELIAYQDHAYAEEFAARVRVVADAERAGLGAPGPLTDAYARNLFKLMAYKDEYEVARLSLDPALDEQVVAQFGEQARYSYRLHPPVLRALGMKKKITLGPWVRPGFRLLYAGRRLRGTGLDVFGRTEVRRTERALPGEYHEAVTRGLPRLSPATLPALVALAELPDMVRGYEHIKLGNVSRYRDALRSALGEIELSAPAEPLS